MSATGMGVIFWPPFIQAPGVGGLPYVGAPAVMFLADRDYTITHIYLHNVHASTTAVVQLGITLGGALLAADDGRKFFRGTLAPGQILDMGTRIPLYRGWALMGYTDVGALGDSMVYAGITGEVSD